MTEPNIIINGVQLTTAQAMAVRVAVGEFALSLRMGGLGDDETGKAMTKGYQDRIWEISKIMSLGKA